MDPDADLRDAGRVRLTELGDQFLSAETRVTGKSKAELIREIVHAFAIREVHRAQMIVRLAHGAKGNAGDEEGRLDE